MKKYLVLLIECFILTVLVIPVVLFPRVFLKGWIAIYLYSPLLFLAPITLLAGAFFSIALVEFGRYIFAVDEYE